MKFSPCTLGIVVVIMCVGREGRHNQNLRLVEDEVFVGYVLSLADDRSGDTTQACGIEGCCGGTRYSPLNDRLHERLWCCCEPRNHISCEGVGMDAWRWSKGARETPHDIIKEGS